MRQVLPPLAHPLLFLRHGQTPWNAKGWYQGIEDIPLNEAGISDAHKNAAIIQRLIKTGTLEQSKLTIVTSPLQRAHKTADTIATDLSLPAPTTNPAFREVSVGHWTGLTTMEVKERYYEERKRRKLDRWKFVPKGGESMQERSTVIQRALTDVKPDAVIVTHSVVLRILWHVLGGVPEQDAAQLHIPHVGLLCWDGTKLENIAEN